MIGYDLNGGGLRSGHLLPSCAGELVAAGQGRLFCPSLAVSKMGLFSFPSQANLFGLHE